MIGSRHRPLGLALTAALGLLVIVPTAHGDPQVRAESMRDQRAKRLAQLGKSQAPEDKKAEAAAPSKYPNATRVSPEAKASGKMVKLLQELQDLYGQQDMAAVITKAEAIASMPSASAYEKSYAYSLAANAASDQDDQAKAGDYFRKAVDTNGLENDGHFATLYNLAVVQFGLERYADSLRTIDRFLAETKSEMPEHRAFRAGILANMDRHDEAAVIYQDLVAGNPDDKRLLMNAVAALQGAEKHDQANLLLEDAYKRGMLTEARELRALYVGYINAQRWVDARRVIDDGLSRGVLQKGPDLARDYMVLAQNAYADDEIAVAIDLYGKAAPMAADGEAFLNLAKVLEFAGKKAEAKEAARRALDKGVKKPDEANAILAR